MSFTDGGDVSSSPVARPMRVAVVRAAIDFRDDRSADDLFYSRASYLRSAIEKEMDRDLSEALGVPAEVEIISIRRGSIIVNFFVLLRVVPEVAKAISESSEWFERLGDVCDDLLERYVQRQEPGYISVAHAMPAVETLALGPGGSRNSTLAATLPPSGPGNRPSRAIVPVVAAGMLVVLVAALGVLFVWTKDLGERQDKIDHKLELVETDLVRIETLMGVTNPQVAAPLRLDHWNAVSPPQGDPTPSSQPPKS